jgi:hypothetical protein
MIRSHILFTLTLSSLIGTAQFTKVMATDRPIHDESIESTRSFSIFGGPTREGPEAQWQQVQESVENIRLRNST